LKTPWKAFDSGEYIGILIKEFREGKVTGLNKMEASPYVQHGCCQALDQAVSATMMIGTREVGLQNHTEVA
jgi:hypothetical protein